MEALTRVSADPGLSVLEMLLRIRDLQVAAEQLHGRLGDGPVGVAEMLRWAEDVGLEAQSLTTDWDRLADLPLPAIAALNDGDFLLLGKVIGDRALVLAPNAARPAVVTRAEFEPLWDGRIVLMGRAGALTRAWRRFAIGPARKARRLFARVGRLAKPLPARDDEQPGARTASAVIIDFADRARKIGRAVGLDRLAEERRRSDELAFLPAALEIVETPPSPLGRAIAFSIIAVFVVALTWACVGTVDIVAVAPGKIIPSGRTKTVQPFEAGVVRAIHVHDGQSVRAGDVLVELDPTMTAAELAHLRSDLTGARLDVARLRAAIDGKDDPLAAFVPPADAPAELVEMQRRFLASQTAEQSAKLAAIDRQVAQKQAERATIKASIEKLKATIAPLQQRVDIRQQLVQKELGSKLTYLSDLQDLVGQQHDILVQQSRYDETDAAIAALRETRSKAVAEYKRGLFEELDKAERKAAGLTQDVVKAQQRTSLRKLTAPVDGIVQQLAVHTIGGVVTPAQPLMVIVPAESRLEIQAMVSNRDIGFVEAGQDAAIKVDTFNFTRYGLLHGKILTVSQDAITRDRPQDNAGDRGQGAEAGSSEPKGQALAYEARVSLDRTQMQIDNKRMNLAPGMAVTVEVKTGTRSIISYLLSPLARYAHDSMRER